MNLFQKAEVGHSFLKAGIMGLAGSGKTYTAKTDKDGDFVIANVEPKEYQGLTVRIFDTDSYVFERQASPGSAPRSTTSKPTRRYSSILRICSRPTSNSRIPRPARLSVVRISSSSGTHIQTLRITS